MHVLTICEVENTVLILKMKNEVTGIKCCISQSYLGFRPEKAFVFYHIIHLLRCDLAAIFNHSCHLSIIQLF